MSGRLPAPERHSPLPQLHGVFKIYFINNPFLSNRGDMSDKGILPRLDIHLSLLIHRINARNVIFIKANFFMSFFHPKLHSTGHNAKCYYERQYTFMPDHSLHCLPFLCVQWPLMVVPRFGQRKSSSADQGKALMRFGITYVFRPTRGLLAGPSKTDYNWSTFDTGGQSCQKRLKRK